MDIIFKEYGRIILQKKGYFALIILGLLVATALDIITPLFYKNIANGLVAEYNDATFTMLLDNLFYIFLAFSAIWVTWRMIEFSILPFEAGGLNLLEKRVFSVLIEQKHEFFENNFSGSLIKQAGRFVSSFEIIMDWLFFQLIQKIFAISAAFIIFFHLSTTFAMYFLVWVIVFMSWSIGFSIWKLRFDKALAAASSKVGAVYSDAISNIFIVKSFALEGKEQARTNDTADELYQRRRISWILMFISFAVQGLLTFAIQLVMIKLMITNWKEGSFDAGEFVLFQSIMLVLIRHMWEFARSFKQIFVALADASEMADVLRNQNIEKDTENTHNIHIKKGNITFNHMSFSYNKGKLFTDFNLSIKAGEKVAFVGHSGSGKTSLTKLLFRFFEPQTGSITFDGHNAQDFTLKSLRQQISLVPQQPELFHRSIRDNIALDKNVDDEALWKAAEKSNSKAFIQKLEQGLDTAVGERGIKLSGGEKQRIAIARAFLEQAPIVILDEATSALDSITEKQIQTAIFELIKDKTAIVIAHRLATVLQMDRIIVLEEGQIIEQGTHKELLQNKGKYYEMWQHQSSTPSTILKE